MTVSNSRLLRRRRSGVIAGLVAGVLALAAAAAVTPAASAVADQGDACHFAAAGSGIYASTLCWFDMTNYDATSAAPQRMHVVIPGGYSLSYDIAVSGGPVAPHDFPTWDAAYLGNDGHYTGVAGEPALYQTTSGSTTTATLSNIVLQDASGDTVTGYSLVGADAESTDSGESLTWSANTPISSINPIGNACGGGFTGVGTTSVDCVGSTNGVKTGTAIVAAEHPTTFTQTMTGSGLEAFSFGVLVSSVQLDTAIVSGYHGDAFGVAVTNSDRSRLAHADTDGGTTASTNSVPVVVDSGGSDFTLSEAASTGDLSDYTVSWSCTRDGVADPTLPSGLAGTTNRVHLGVGDAVECAITNTGKTRALTMVQHAGTPTDVNHDGHVDAGDTVPYTFTVTNTGAVPLTGITVQNGRTGPVSCPSTTLAVGASQTCTTDAPYTIGSADVAAGAVINTATATATAVGNAEVVTSAPSTTSTAITVPAPAPVLTLVQTASASSVVAAGQRITLTFAVTNAGNVAVDRPAVREGMFSGGGVFPVISCPTTPTLAPGATMLCTAAYTVVAADLHHPTLTNSADAVATLANGSMLSASPSEITVAVAVPHAAPAAAPAPATPAVLAFTGADVVPIVFTSAALLILGTVALIGTIVYRRRTGAARDGQR